MSGELYPFSSKEPVKLGELLSPLGKRSIADFKAELLATRVEIELLEEETLHRFLLGEPYTVHYDIMALDACVSIFQDPSGEILELVNTSVIRGVANALTKALVPAAPVEKPVHHELSIDNDMELDGSSSILSVSIWHNGVEPT